MTPFANEEEVLELDELTIENRVDKLEIYGSLHLTRDQKGLELARRLHALLGETIRILESQPLPEQITLRPDGEMDNPFH